MDTKTSLKLNGTKTLEMMIEALVDDLKMIGGSRTNIYNFDEALENMRGELETYGWGSEKPFCRVEVEETGKGVRISLRTCGANEALVFQEEFTFHEDSDIESMIDSLDEGILSDYSIENKEEFRMMMRGIYDEDELIETEDREETELISSIEGYRKEGKFRAMCAHTNNLVEHYIKQERLDSAIESVDKNISTLMTLDLDDEEVKWHMFIARVLKADILIRDNNHKYSIKEIDAAFEIIPDDIAVWKLGVRKREYFERGISLRVNVTEDTDT